MGKRRPFQWGLWIHFGVSPENGNAHDMASCGMAWDGLVQTIWGEPSVMEEEAI